MRDEIHRKRQADKEKEKLKEDKNIYTVRELEGGSGILFYFTFGGLVSNGWGLG